MNIKRTFLFALMTILFFCFLSCKKTWEEKSREALSELESIKKDKGDRHKSELLLNEGLEHHKKKEYQQAEKLWIQSAKSDPSWWNPYFNLACVKALTGNIEHSIRYLKIALSVDYSPAMLKYIRNDADLSSIRNSPDYKLLLSKWVYLIIGKKLKCYQGSGEPNYDFSLLPHGKVEGFIDGFGTLYAEECNGQNANWEFTNGLLTIEFKCRYTRCIDPMKEGLCEKTPVEELSFKSYNELTAFFSRGLDICRKGGTKF